MSTFSNRLRLLVLVRHSSIGPLMIRRLLPRLLITAVFAITGNVEGQSLQPQSVSGQIDTLIQQQWDDFDVQPSEPASDGEWVRRIYLDLLGRIPRTSEYRRFVRSKSNRKKAELVETLLYGDEYTTEFARNWATIWTNLLIGRNGGSERNSLTNREGMQKFLRDAFARNQSYDWIVSQLLTATGNSQPGTENFNGAVNFLAMKLGDEATQATADVSRLFLGKQVQCTQCHDHPFNDWKQNQFWELNAFFRQTVPLRRFDPTDDMVSHIELADQDFGGEGNTPDEAEVYFEVRDATLRSAYPVFIDGRALANKSGRLSDVNRREALAKFVLQSQELPNAIANRMWGHFFNQGFTTPVDDMGPHNPATHPQVLELLANELATNSFDLRLLMKWIVNTRAYSLSSRITKHNAMDSPSNGERPLFSHYYLRQMRAEELFDSLIIATGADRLGNQRDLDATRRDWLQQFVVAFGNDEGTEGSTFDGTITQALVLFNGELMRKALADSPNSLLYRLANSTGSLEQKINHLYVAGLSRSASKREKLAAKQLISWRAGDTTKGLQDLWWAILNSNEFILNH